MQNTESVHFVKSVFVVLLTNVTGMTELKLSITTLNDTGIYCILLCIYYIPVWI